MSNSRDNKPDLKNQDLINVVERDINIDDSDISSFFSSDISSDEEPEVVLKNVELKFTSQCEIQQNNMSTSLYSLFTSFFICSTSKKDEITISDKNVSILKPKIF